MRFLHDIGYLVAHLFGFKTIGYQTIYTENVPETVEEWVLYIIGDKESYWCIKLKCPCGCGEEIQLSLLPGKPIWNFNVHWNGSVTVAPSVWRSKGCLSHFFIVRGKVVWVNSRGRSEYFNWTV